MGTAFNISENTILELNRRLEHYQAPGIFTIDARRFLTLEGSSILAEIASLQNRVEQANRQYDLDSLPLIEQDVEDAKAKARIARDKIHAHKATEIEVLRRASATSDSYQNAVDKLMNLQRIELDKYASKDEIYQHNKNISKAQSEVDRREAAMSDIYLDQSSYRREFQILSDAYIVADAAVTKAQAMLKAVQKRLGIVDANPVAKTNELGFTS